MGQRQETRSPLTVIDELPGSCWDFVTGKIANLGVQDVAEGQWYYIN